MLLSMTGFGEAARQQNGCSAQVEIRTVNNRYFKLVAKLPDGYGQLEAELEGVVRNHIKRGTVTVAIRLDRPRRSDDFRLNVMALGSYRKQLEQLRAEWNMVEPVRLEHLLSLPGVVQDESDRSPDLEVVWPLIKETVEAALLHHQKMRLAEGDNMATDLRTNCAKVAAELAAIQTRAPLVVDTYRARLVERVQSVLAQFQVQLQPGDLIREVSIYAERSDISEEIVRLGSHLEQMHALIAEQESSGRKLDFLTQEMFRETNTIGSKSNDVQIARHVVEIKSAIEKIREMVQNVE